MPLLRNRPLTLRTSSVRYIARNIETFWNEEWDAELKKITKLSDAIVFNIRKKYNKEAIKIYYYFYRYVNGYKQDVREAYA